MQQRAKRYDRGQVRWSARDERLLTWLGEQWIIRQDQLELLAGRWPEKETKRPGRLGATTVRDLVSRWRRAGVVQSGTLFIGQRPWCWLTPQGQALVGLNIRAWEPTAKGLRTLEHRYYVNQVRLWLERTYPQAIWKSERRLRQEWRPRRKGPQPHLPDAEVSYQGQTIAIEVELSAKQPEQMQGILEELAARYPQIWYFVSAAMHAPQTPLQTALAALDAGSRARFVLSRLDETAYRQGA